MSIIASILLSLISIRGFRYTPSEEGLVPANVHIAVRVLLFAVQALILYRSFRDPDRRLKAHAGAFGLITGAFCSLGLSMDRAGTLSWILRNTGCTVNFLNIFFTRSLLCYCFAYAVYSVLKMSGQRDDRRSPYVFSFKRALLWWVLLSAAFLPWFLHFYPGNLTQDSEDMILQALGMRPLNDHHSVLVTLALRAVMTPIVHLTGSAGAGVSAFLCLQMLSVAFIFALNFEWIRGYVRPVFLRVLFFLWFAAYPINPMYSITLWKDVPFSLCFLCLMLCVNALAQDAAAYFGSRRKLFRLFLALLLLPILRHNGIAVTLAVSVYIAAAFKPFRRKASVICGSALLLAVLWNQILLPALHVDPVSPGLGLSVFHQQIARTIAGHTDELSEEETASLTACYDIDDIWTRYNPIISDSVKKHFVDEVYEKDPAAFLKGWARLGLRYPLDYIEAFLHNNYGYWFPDPKERLPYAHDIYVIESVEGLRPSPVLEFPLISRIYRLYADQIEKASPVSLLFSPGICCWLWFLCGIWSLYRKNRKLILFIPGLTLWLTVLISPVFNEIRYVYGLFIALPLVLASSLTSRRGE